MGDFGPEYCKINTIWKRDPEGKVMIGDWSRPESAFLGDLQWRWTEKIDGTNIRLHRAHKGGTVRVGGRTDKAQLPKDLEDNLACRGVLDAHKWDQLHEKAGPDTPITVYGEGFGAGIQKGGGNYQQEKGVIVFDVKIGHWWLQDDDVAEIADLLGLPLVPYVGTFSPKVAWYRIVTGDYASQWPDVKIEGFVGKPMVDLADRKGDRVIMKVKVKDWEDRRKADGVPRGL